MDCKKSKDGLGKSIIYLLVVTFSQVLCCSGIANGEIVPQFYENILKPDFCFFRSKAFQDFVTVCLTKDYQERPDCEKLQQVFIIILYCFVCVFASLFAFLVAVLSIWDERRGLLGQCRKGVAER